MHNGVFHCHPLVLPSWQGFGFAFYNSGMPGSFAFLYLIQFLCTPLPNKGLSDFSAHYEKLNTECLNRISVIS